MKSRFTILLVFLFLSFVGCQSSEKKTVKTADKEITFPIKNLSDTDYPDNPDIGFRAENYQNQYFTNGNLKNLGEDFKYNFSFFTQPQGGDGGSGKSDDGKLDTIFLNNLDISEFIPTIPENIKPNEYMSHVSCVNQEFNRNQVEFAKGEFTSSTPKFVRVDLARNCLNSYLWEIIPYVEENGKKVPFAHGWFDFPHDLYSELFEKKNGIPFSKYKSSLENWVDLENKEVDLEILRTKTDPIKISFKDKSDEMYPLAGARVKKFKEIIFPKSFKTMRDLQSDSTLFATFTPPGFYNRDDPRTTELGRFFKLNEIKFHKMISKANGDTLYELELNFLHKDGLKKTTLILGGIDTKQFQVLAESDANKGWKSSMGIGNHPFYEKYHDHLSTHSKHSPYYALLLDENNRWLDSHFIGIDGPIFHFSNEERTQLHLWLLSFERHALVGHYEINLLK